LSRIGTGRTEHWLSRQIKYGERNVRREQMIFKKNTECGKHGVCAANIKM